MEQVIPYTRAERKEIRSNMQRMFRVVEYFDFSGVLESCPVQVEEGYVISDYETHELFASFAFRNTSDRPIRSLSIRLYFYQYANVPYEKRSFTYSYGNLSFGVRRGGDEPKHKLFGRTEYSDCITVGETFGRTAYIKIPEAYFRRIELEISSVVFDDGASVSPALIVKNRYTPFDRLGDDEKYAFSRMNIYSAAEEKHPTKVIPQFGQTAWLCCCGHKNLSTSDKCEVCMRDREWQAETFSQDAMTQKIGELQVNNDFYHHDTTKYSQTKYLETEEEIAEKIKDYEKAIQHVAEQERKKEHDRKMIIPKILLYIAVFYAIYLLLSYIVMTFQT